ncbi:hypothetical protein LB505_003973 [Fusarium chuoi]|nr:hypothetical protein LB505_003973 [Fusarium chuoi]
MKLLLTFILSALVGLTCGLASTDTITWGGDNSRTGYQTSTSSSKQPSQENTSVPQNRSSRNLSSTLLQAERRNMCTSRRLRIIFINSMQRLVLFLHRATSAFHSLLLIWMVVLMSTLLSVSQRRVLLILIPTRGISRQRLMLIRMRVRFPRADRREGIRYTLSM